VLRASATDADGAAWRSEATFRADRRGVVDVARRAPSAGTYAGVEPMGLFWSMRRDGPPAAARAGIQDLLLPPEGPMFARKPAGAVEVRLEAIADGAVIASAVATRQWTLPEVKVTEVGEDGLVGRLYEPPGDRRAAILVLSGSNGGIQASHAPMLAAQGYVVFSLAYFRAPGLPKDLVEIPLEYLQRGMDWLRARPSVDPERLAVFGLSRGAELALLLGAHYPEIKAVVAIAPSHVVWEGAVRDPEKKGLAALRADRSGWTVGGEPVAFVPKTIGPALAAKVEAGERFVAAEMMRLDGVDPERLARAEIPVERINGPVFLVSSRADRMWPAADMAAAVVARLKARRFPHRVESWTFDDAAHALPDSWMPIAHGGTLGGTAAGNAHAFADYWPKLRAFLRTALSPPAGRR
jgi:dienelactone hydrolase